MRNVDRPLGGDGLTTSDALGSQLEDDVVGSAFRLHSLTLRSNTDGVKLGDIDAITNSVTVTKAVVLLIRDTTKNLLLNGEVAPFLNPHVFAERLKCVQRLCILALGNIVEVNVFVVWWPQAIVVADTEGETFCRKRGEGGGLGLRIDQCDGAQEEQEDTLHAN